MSAFEDSYKSPLQGVSQQIARERLDGQVTAQDNMLSDAVTNLRRRPGAAYAYDLPLPGGTDSSVLAWETDLAGIRCHVILNTADGVIRVLDTNYTELTTLPASAYLTTADPSDIQVATVGDEFFLCNTTKVPVLGASSAVTAPSRQGFFYIKSGAFSKTYEIKVKTAAGEKLYTVTTPDGTSAGDAALANPITIAATFATDITADIGLHNVAAVVDGPYVYLSTGSNNLVASSNAGSNYVVTSGASYLRQEADLPSRLPFDAHGYIISTGELRSLRYYQYDGFKMAWLETGDYTSPLTLTNVPVSVTQSGGVWSLMTTAFEGRFAGDADSNPDPDFVLRGITGMSNYQGRLILLSGSLVSMSAAGKPRRFYRSTVTALLDSDCISVGASAASSAAYRYAVPFGRDLLLFSEKYQAVVPGSAQAITPRTASVVVTSTYEADMTSAPVTCGRTLMYSMARSKSFFGLLEMMPSQSVEGQYTSYDSTAHLPKYMAGRCRFAVSSSGANMVLFAPTHDRYSLIVHEYTWEGEQKIQQAWHRWTFKYKVAAAYFAGQTVHVIFVNNNHLVACTIDPRSGGNTESADHLAKLDMLAFTEVTDRVVELPAWVTVFDPACRPALRMSVASGALAGEPVGSVVEGGVLKTDISYPNGRVGYGFPFLSVFCPTPPMMKDKNGVKISSNKMTVLRFMLGTNNSPEYKVAVSDTATVEPHVIDAGTLFYSSSELAPGSSRSAGDSTVVVPARTNANSTSLVVSTDGVGELNVVALEYVAKYNEKIKRSR